MSIPQEQRLRLLQRTGLQRLRRLAARRAWGAAARARFGERGAEIPRDRLAPAHLEAIGTISRPWLQTGLPSASPRGNLLGCKERGERAKARRARFAGSGGAYRLRTGVAGSCTGPMPPPRSLDTLRGHSRKRGRVFRPEKACVRAADGLQTRQQRPQQAVPQHGEAILEMVWAPKFQPNQKRSS